VCVVSFCVRVCGVCVVRVCVCGVWCERACGVCGCVRGVHLCGCVYV